MRSSVASAFAVVIGLRYGTLAHPRRDRLAPERCAHWPNAASFHPTPTPAIWRPPDTIIARGKHCH